MIELSPQTTLKNRTYQIVKLIAKGGQAYVYLALDLSNQNSEVVIKQTETGGSDEYEILKELDHPSLPKIIIEPFIEAVEGETYQFLVMEYIEGQTLRFVLDKSDVPYIQALSWAKQLLDILIYLQTSERRIIHKDICPNNIIVDDSNKIFLIDFGISKKADAYDSSTGGTKYYTAPEQFSEDAATDFRSDIYSFSATIYHLLTNQKPEISTARKEAVEGGRPDPLVSLIELCEGLPQSLSDLIAKGMSLNPDTRPADANRMKILLEEAEKDISFQNISDTSQSSEPEITTMTTPTKIREKIPRIVIPIKPPKKASVDWGIRNIKKDSEARYSLYFLEDAIKADKDEREEIKERFISVTGRSRIDDDRDLQKLLNILEKLCKNSDAQAEGELTREIQLYRENLEAENHLPDKPMIDQRTAKLYLFRLIVGFLGLLVLSLIFFSAWYVYAYFSSPAANKSNPSPSPSSTRAENFIGQKGKIKESVNLREDAGQNFKKIGVLYPNTEIVVQGFRNNENAGKTTIWFKVKVLSYGCNSDIPQKCGKDNPNDADEGWVSGKFIKDLQQ